MGNKNKNNKGSNKKVDKFTSNTISHSNNKATAENKSKNNSNTKKAIGSDKKHLDNRKDSSNKDNLLRNEIISLGGNEEDFKLLENVDSDDEHSFGDKENKDKNLLKDLQNFMKDLDFDSAQLKDLDDNDESVKNDNVDKDDVDNGSQSDNSINNNNSDDDKSLNESEESESESENENENENILDDFKNNSDDDEIDPFNEIDPDGPFGRLPQWFSQPLPKLNPNSKLNQINSQTLEQLTNKGNKLLEELQKSSSSSAVSSSDKSFLEQILKSGTLSDRVSALALLVAESPIHSVQSLESLKSMAGKPKREEALRAMRVLIDWLAGPSGLPANRKLSYIADQPLLSHPQIKDKHLTFYAFENYLKNYFFDVLRLLESFSHDTLLFIRSQSIMFISQLLREKPEQEHNLLRLLINKLGDPSRQVASKASNEILVILQAHPAMKGVISREVSDLLFRPGVSEPSKYYSIITLNQIMFSPKVDTGVANKLIEIYFSCFNDILREEEQQYKKSNEQVKNKKGNKDKKNNKKGDHDAEDIEALEEKRSKMIAGILTGVHRALPYSNIDEKMFDGYMNTLFRITHTGTFNISIQALQLIFQVTIIKETISDRFYRTLYDSLLDSRLSQSSKQTMYLNLLFGALKRDPSKPRIAAFVKRIFQVLLNQQPPFICGSFYHFGQLFSAHPSLRSMISESEENENSSASTSYDKFKRDPQYANAQHTCLWELTLFLNHYHPSVSLHAHQLLKGEVITSSPDLNLQTLMHFLDRFVYRNPKKNVKPKGASLMQPLAAADRSTTVSNIKGGTDEMMVNSSQFLKKKVENIPPDQLFFHKFFTQKSQRQAEKDKKIKKRKGDSDEDEIKGDSDEESDDVDIDVNEHEQSDESENEDKDEGEDFDEDASEIDEDEVWKAMQASMPGQENEDLEESDDDDDIDPEALQYSDDEDEDKSENKDENKGESESDDDDHEEGSKDDENIEEDDDDDNQDGIEGLDEDDDDLVAVDDINFDQDDASSEDNEEEEEEEEMSGKRKRNAKTSKKKSKKPKLPLFASAEDYAHLLSD